MDDQNKNLMLAMGLSVLVIVIWYSIFPPPEPETAITDAQPAATTPVADAPSATITKAEAEAEAPIAAPRIAIETPSLTGSISLLGGRVDELSLNDYRVTIKPDSENVDLLKPVGDAGAYYTVYGWAAGNGLTPDQVPSANTVWTAVSDVPLTPETPVTLTWDNGAGLLFTRTISVDDKFMFTVDQNVQNNSGATVSLAPYGILARHGKPEDMKNFFILHEGLIQMADGELSEIDYDGVMDYGFNAREGAKAETTQVSEGGWLGFTDHYWMTTLIPEAGFKSVSKYDDRRDIFQTETVMPTQTVAAGDSVTTQSRLFAGAKEWATIRAYQNDENVDRFIDSIDWGWFFFLTKPIFAVLHALNVLIGNMGWAIIALTVLIKGILFPLAYKSYASMAKMKELQPQMEKIREAAGDDRQKMQQDMMALYKKEKVNPASGCLPILLQIPIFFSLYKVIFVTLELRHAPWIGWIKDLSAPDPSSFFNLFGLMPWAVPEPGSLLALIAIGILPILLGISMWLQQKLNPAPADPMQQQIFAWMPWVFMFMLGGFASGLVVYWIANNTITFVQQYLIMRQHGYKADVFGNIKDSFKRKPKSDDKG